MCARPSDHIGAHFDLRIVVECFFHSASNCTEHIHVYTSVRMSHIPNVTLPIRQTNKLAGSASPGISTYAYG